MQKYREPRPLRVLVIEGGGMRASYLCGVLCTLAIHGIRPECFDLVVAVSGGAFSAAYFLAGQAGLGYAVWRRLTDRRFIHRLTNLFVGKPIFDLTYLEEVCTRVAPLDAQRIVASPTEFRIVVTDCRDGKPQYIQPTAETLIPAIMTSSSYPPFRRPNRFNGGRYCDGALADPLPIEYAMDRGGTKILVLSTTPARFRQSRASTLTTALSWIAFPFNKQMRKMYQSAAGRYNAGKDICALPLQGGELAIIQPEQMLPSWQLDDNQQHMFATMKQGECDALAALKRGDIQRLFIT